jgi:hypothetical protein
MNDPFSRITRIRQYKVGMLQRQASDPGQWSPDLTPMAESDYFRPAELFDAQSDGCNMWMGNKD